MLAACKNELNNDRRYAHTHTHSFRPAAVGLCDRLDLEPVSNLDSTDLLRQQGDINCVASVAVCPFELRGGMITHLDPLPSSFVTVVPAGGRELINDRHMKKRCANTREAVTC